MGAIAMLCGNLIKARKMQTLLQKEKKTIDEVEDIDHIFVGR